MTRINTNVPSLIAQRVLGQNNASLNSSLERLSTGLQINRGKDNPAGLIASQNLRAEKAAIGAAISNAERADQVANIAEGGLNEVSGLLTELQSLVTATANTAGLSLEEKEANQLQIDSILQTIDRVASSTSFQGQKLLNGSYDYSTENVAGTVNQFKVNAAKLEFNGTRDVDVVVTGSAQVAGYFLSFGSANINLGGAGAADGADEQFVIEIAGELGSRELSFASGTDVADIVSTINSFTDVTGVEASVSGGTGVRLESTTQGSDKFVSVTVVDDGAIDGSDGIYNLSANNVNALGSLASTFAAATNKLTDEGQDVEATINGIVATTRGTTARINTDFLDVEIDLDYDLGNASAATLGAISAFTITGGGADFQLAGRVDIGGKVGIGVGNVAVRELGRETLDVNDSSGSPVSGTYTLDDLRSGAGLNVVDGDLTAAQQIVDSAIGEVSSLRGRLGSFQQNTIGATIRSLGISLENTTAAEFEAAWADALVSVPEPAVGGGLLL
ncbi:MAG: flagellin hook IN motif-containing protein, partial [Actinomycetota bacterium]